MSDIRTVRTIALIVYALSEAQRTPSGVLYAQLMGYATMQNTEISLNEYKEALTFVKASKLAYEENNMLIWIEPLAGTPPAKLVEMLKGVINQAAIELVS